MICPGFRTAKEITIRGLTYRIRQSHSQTIWRRHKLLKRPHLVSHVTTYIKPDTFLRRSVLSFLLATVCPVEEIFPVARPFLGTTDVLKLMLPFRRVSKIIPKVSIEIGERSYCLTVDLSPCLPDRRSQREWPTLTHY